MAPAARMLGGGGFFGNVGPRGPYGPWPTCGCSSILIVIAGILLVFAGCSGMFGGILIVPARLLTSFHRRKKHASIVWGDHQRRVAHRPGPGLHRRRHIAISCTYQNVDDGKVQFVEFRHLDTALMVAFVVLLDRSSDRPGRRLRRPGLPPPPPRAGTHPYLRDRRDDAPDGDRPTTLGLTRACGERFQSEPEA